MVLVCYYCADPSDPTLMQCVTLFAKKFDFCSEFSGLFVVGCPKLHDPVVYCAVVCFGTRVP